MKRAPTDPRIEQSILYLVETIQASGKSTKPVIYHSLKIALYLDRLGYPADTVIAAILHDLLEDSAASSEDLRRIFGNKIATLVGVLSYNPGIQDRLERAKNEITRAKEYGEEALIIKAADIIDNSQYYSLAGSEEMLTYLKEKVRYFRKTAEAILAPEPLWADFIIQYKEAMKTELI